MKKIYFLLPVFLLFLDVHSQVIKIKLDTFATNINKPVVVTNDRNTSKMYVVSQDGYIIVVDSLGTKIDTFLKITDRVQVSSEQGLLGLTFHPNYANNGYFYVNYTRKTDGAIRISRFKVSANPNRAIADSELIVLTFAHPVFTNHNGGDLHFGPDGYLYISSGDGGSGGDPNNNAQNKNSYLGKILRIDVDGGSPYAIPTTNPFFNESNVKKEIWSWGLRNPWRFSFDRMNNDVWIADVGQGAKEEVNFQKASSPGGENYGWRCYEADQGYNTSGCGPITNYVAPIYSYGHSSSTGGFAIIGGYVYRGNKYDDIKGIYMFTDYSTGNFWVTQKINDSTFNTARLPEKIVTGISAFGEDKYGEIYLTNVDRRLVYKLRELCSPFTAKITVSSNPCFPVNNGAVQLTVSNPNGNPSIKWSNGDSATTTPTGLSSGKIVVTVRDAVGCVRKDSVVLVEDTIPKPVITQNGNVLSTSGGVSYKWFLNGILLLGRVSDTLQASVSGNYQAEITDGQGCRSTSDNFPFIVTKSSVQKNDFEKFSIAPNPASDMIKLEIASKISPIRSFSLTTVDGKIVTEKLIGQKQFFEILSVSNYPKGIYLVRIKLENGNEVTEQVILQ